MDQMINKVEREISEFKHMPLNMENIEYLGCLTDILKDLYEICEHQEKEMYDDQYAYARQSQYRGESSEKNMKTEKFNHIFQKIKEELPRLSDAHDDYGRTNDRQYMTKAIEYYQLLCNMTMEMLNLVKGLSVYPEEKQAFNNMLNSIKSS